MTKIFLKNNVHRLNWSWPPCLSHEQKSVIILYWNLSMFAHHLTRPYASSADPCNTEMLFIVQPRVTMSIYSADNFDTEMSICLEAEVVIIRKSELRCIGDNLHNCTSAWNWNRVKSQSFIFSLHHVAQMSS